MRNFNRTLIYPWKAVFADHKAYEAKKRRGIFFIWKTGTKYSGKSTKQLKKLDTPTRCARSDLSQFQSLFCSRATDFEALKFWKGRSGKGKKPFQNSFMVEELRTHLLIDAKKFCRSFLLPFFWSKLPTTWPSIEQFYSQSVRILRGTETSIEEFWVTKMLKYPIGQLRIEHISFCIKEGASIFVYVFSDRNH